MQGFEMDLSEGTLLATNPPFLTKLVEAGDFLCVAVVLEIGLMRLETRYGLEDTVIRFCRPPKFISFIASTTSGRPQVVLPGSNKTMSRV